VWPRVGLSGAQGLYGVTPDLTALGKQVVASASRRSSALIPSGVRHASACPLASALVGMPSNFADAGSWTKVTPPAYLIAASPRVPSVPVPDRTTPIAAEP